MPGRVRSVRQENGSLKDEWMLEPLTIDTSVSPFYFRPDFIPPAPLFRTIVFGFVLATEEFADRVTRAGVTGIGFREVEGERASKEVTYREPLP